MKIKFIFNKVLWAFLCCLSFHLELIADHYHLQPIEKSNKLSDHIGLQLINESYNSPQIISWNIEGLGMMSPRKEKFFLQKGFSANFNNIYLNNGLLYYPLFVFNLGKHYLGLSSEFDHTEKERFFGYYFPNYFSYYRDDWEKINNDYLISSQVRVNNQSKLLKKILQNDQTKSSMLALQEVVDVSELKSETDSNYYLLQYQKNKLEQMKVDNPANVESLFSKKLGKCDRDSNNEIHCKSRFNTLSFIFNKQFFPNYKLVFDARNDEFMLPGLTDRGIGSMELDYTKQYRRMMALEVHTDQGRVLYINVHLLYDPKFYKMGEPILKEFEKIGQAFMVSFRELIQTYDKIFVQGDFNFNLDWAKYSLQPSVDDEFNVTVLPATNFPNASWNFKTMKTQRRGCSDGFIIIEKSRKK